ncbi:cyclic AMP-responsive element-binding protein 3-like protein 2 [Anthonomus grandis grandis]|uniref:cyclic AMP-responsive element-binding protein 3-like protein 2 n=1 Tax=Anthonomus grandis grandis TaxID=2921223 RepID=UPI0021664FE0|nr:cyclic AMP-responsive element-binding protein 3-like protein 2 [Anthonomus grandis grandis]
MNITDILVSSGAESNNMDISLNYETAELMSSEFFDSVLSLENDLEDGFLSSFDEDNNMSSDASHSDASHSDDVLSPRSYYSESDKNSTYSSENADVDPSQVLNTIDDLDDPMLLSFLDNIAQDEAKPIPVVAIPQNPLSLPTAPKTTKILIQNPSNKKCIAKPLSNASQLRKPLSKVKHQVLKVQQITNNGRPLFLPINFKNVKILGPTTEVSLANNKICKIEPIHSTNSEDDQPAILPNHPYPPLNLNNEEKRLLAKEGIQLPTHYPLTKNEERELKRIRRKIRNKISAQDSRKRKKEYVDGLEERVKRGSQENKNLLQKVRELQRQNRTLIAHVNKLQALICKSSTSKATPSTCLMVVLLSALLISLPNIRLFQNKQLSTVNEQVSIRRSLLSDLQATEEDLNMEEFLIFNNDEADLEAKIGDAIDNSSEAELSKLLDTMSNKYEDLKVDKNDSDKISILGNVIEAMKGFIAEKKTEMFEIKTHEIGGTLNSKGFIEPDIDDYLPGDEGPLMKRVKYDLEITSTNLKGIPATATNQVVKDK